eukprot:CAMPEP_0182917380 /NCGR_PEP_ID=MMETSP0105_2-20130417/1485_1 /TAXON_ID=81532 ORGANISM="Acanthoeca-like sp., Strain 10tr" /NCGR_SAMPLE_ID=MMETSP0105_2 /ASSEMBLY_ACC=CAM_ASM_000205 /LENGTH=481 /DNA_ID=CAMNT_0025054385 /DNA_START=465 /DNA_END=1910 /DNA_ORIENTATION=-
MSLNDSQLGSVADYSFEQGVPFSGNWDIAQTSEKIIASPYDGYLSFVASNPPAADQLSITCKDAWSTSSLDGTHSGCNLVFSIRTNTVQNMDEVKFVLSAGVILRFLESGTVVEYQWYNSGTQEFMFLGHSEIRSDSQWHNVVMAITPDRVELFEDHSHLFTWTSAQIGQTFHPMFSMEVPSGGEAASIDLGDVIVMPQVPSLTWSSQWDYVFTTTPPEPDLITFHTDPNLPVAFNSGFLTFSGSGSMGSPTDPWTHLNVVGTAPAEGGGVFVYYIRPSVSEGPQTLVELPGGNFLRIQTDGTVVTWSSFDAVTKQYTDLAPSGILPGQAGFTAVTVVVGPTCACLLEEGVFKFSRSYPEQTDWSPSISLQHNNTQLMSVDIGGIRTVPSTQLVIPSRLAYPKRGLGGVGSFMLAKCPTATEFNATAKDPERGISPMRSTSLCAVYIARALLLLALIVAVRFVILVLKSSELHMPRILALH